jgi:NOL1/NOP2/fmu family ribosome biogenesis protein
MKPFAVALAFVTVLLPLASAQGQGTINFSNRVLGGGVNAPVFDVDGVTKLDGGAFVAQLYAGASADNLSPIGGAVSFFSGAGAGHFSGGTRIIPTVTPGGVAIVQVRVWASAWGSTYEAAWAAGGDTGVSEMFEVVTGGDGAPPSVPANLVGLKSFQLVAATPPTIPLQPLSQEVIAGATVTFTVAAAGSEPLSFQWRKNGLDLPGATAATLVLEDVQATDAGEYVAIARNFFGSATSAPAALTVHVPPALVVGPQSQIVLAGTDVMFRAEAMSAEPMEFQWRKDGADLPDATLPTLTLTRVSPAQAGHYSVLVRNAAGETISPAASLEVRFQLVAMPGAGGAVGIAPALSSFAPGATAMLTATPNPDFAFMGWSGDASGDANPLTVTMDAHKLITANFRPAYALSTAVTGEGSIVVSPQKDRYAAGEVVLLTATPAPGWAFGGWSGARSAATPAIPLTMDGHQSVTANFKRLRSLITTVAGQGVVTRSPDAASYLDGAVVQLTARSANGWQFVGWSGALSGAANPASVTLDADASVTAIFKPTYKLAAAVTGEGTIAFDSQKEHYLDGEVVTLTATAAEGWQFVGWTGAVNGLTDRVGVLMDADKEVGALFLQVFTVSALVEGNGSVTWEPLQATYLDGTAITVTATPGSALPFTGWSGDLAGATNPVKLVIDGHKLFTAHFATGYPIHVKTTGQGRVARSPEAEVYAAGQLVELTAVADEGWRFVGWEGATTGTEDRLTVPVEGGVEVRALFKPAAEPKLRETGFQATLAAQPDKAYVIEASTDFRNWTVVATVASVTGALTFSDPEAPRHEARFYRARLVE